LKVSGKAEVSGICSYLLPCRTDRQTDGDQSIVSEAIRYTTAVQYYITGPTARALLIASDG